MKIFKIYNDDYETKEVVAYDMAEALRKYENYLVEHINPDYSYQEIMRQVKLCEYVGEYKEKDYIK